MISPQSFSTMGGLPLHVARLAEALVSSGVKLEVIAPLSTSMDHILAHSFPVVSIRVTASAPTVRSLEFCYKAYRYLKGRGKQPDAIHGSQWSPYLLVRRQREIKAPVITKFHGTTWYGALVRIRSRTSGFAVSLRELAGASALLHAERTLAARSAGLIFISSSVRREVESMTHGNLCESNRVIYNGVDINRFRPLNTATSRKRYALSSADKVVLYVGRLDPLKGVDRLIVVSKQLMAKHDNLRVIIAGAGEQSYLARVMSMATPRDRFLFTGWIDQSRLAEIYSLADVVVAPSEYSGGNTVLESMACAKPVVVTPGSGFSELVKHLETGFVTDDEHMQNCLAFALSDPGRLERIGRTARVFAERNLSWEKTALNTVEFVQRVREKNRHIPA